jgi:hypothetical protein
MYMVTIHNNNNFLKLTENLLIYQCLASNPKQCIMRLVYHHLFLKFFPSSLHTKENLTFKHRIFFDGVILRLGIR